MKKIAVFQIGDLVPDNAIPIGVVLHMIPSEDPWEKSKEMIRFYYEIPTEGAIDESAARRKIQAKSR